MAVRRMYAGLPHKFSIKLLISEDPETFADLATTYPTAVDGWTASTLDTDLIYRFDGTTWQLLPLETIPLATDLIDGKMAHADFTLLHTIESQIGAVTTGNIYDKDASGLHDSGLKTLAVGESNIYFFNRPKTPAGVTETFLRYEDNVQIPLVADATRGFDPATYNGLISFYIGKIEDDSAPATVEFGDEDLYFEVGGSLSQIYLNDGGLHISSIGAKLKDVYGKQVMCWYSPALAKSCVLVGITEQDPLPEPIDLTTVETIDPYTEPSHTYTVSAATKENVIVESSDVGGIITFPIGLLAGQHVYMTITEASNIVTVNGTSYDPGTILSAVFHLADDLWYIEQVVEGNPLPEPRTVYTVLRSPRIDSGVLYLWPETIYIPYNSTKTNTDMSGLVIGDLVLLKDITASYRGIWRVDNINPNTWMYLSKVYPGEIINLVRVAEGFNIGLWMNNYIPADGVGSMIFTKVGGDTAGQIYTLIATTTDGTTIVPFIGDTIPDLGEVYSFDFSIIREGASHNGYARGSCSRTSGGSFKYAINYGSYQTGTAVTMQTSLATSAGVFFNSVATTPAFSTVGGAGITSTWELKIFNIHQKTT